MEDNVINLPDGRTAIINGGNPLNDCPTNSDDANKWQNLANEEDPDCEDSNPFNMFRPKWRWDCGFKLDYDGGMLSISSRFYPPKTHYGETWDGTVGVYLLGEMIREKKFDCETLEQLKQEVEGYVQSLEEKLKNLCTDISL